MRARHLAAAVAAGAIRGKVGAGYAPSVPLTGSPEDLQKIFETDLNRWRKVITDAKLQQQ